MAQPDAVGSKPGGTPAAPKRSAWPWAHVAIAAVGAVAFYALAFRSGQQAATFAFLDERRTGLYTSAVALSGTVLGFSLASLTFAFTLIDSPRLVVIRDAGWLRPLYDVFVGALTAFSIMLIAAVAALLFDRDGHPNRLLTALLVGSGLLGLLRLLRLLTVLSSLVRTLVTQGGIK
ncbi:hypothetical protein [Jatrophihabitans fulvus]